MFTFGAVSSQSRSNFGPISVRFREMNGDEHVPTYEKSGTAILLFRDSRLWYCLLFQTATLSPRRMYMCTPNSRVLYYTHHEHLVLQCFGTYWIYQIPNRQNKALKTPFSICPYPTHCKDKSLAWAKYECKITNNFWIVQICKLHFAIFTQKPTKNRL